MRSRSKVTKPKLLLHICCAPDAVAAIPELKRDYQVAGFFYNPNITSEEEYKKRLTEVEKLAKKQGYTLLSADYEGKKWHQAVSGLEKEPEGGKRCEVCFALRLERTAKRAKEKGYHLFATVLTNSPHKDSALINHIGRELGAKHQVLYFRSNFKKRGGFSSSVKLSKQLGLYRQNYCGCKFSERT